MTRVDEIGRGLGTDWGACEGMEGLVNVSRGSVIGGSSDGDRNASIGVEMEVKDQGSDSGRDVGYGGVGTDGRDGSNDDGNDSNDDGNGRDGNGHDGQGNERMLRLVPDILSGKEPVDYYRLFILEISMSRH